MSLASVCARPRSYLLGLGPDTGDVVLDRPSDGFRGLGNGRALLPEAKQYLGVGALAGVGEIDRRAYAVVPSPGIAACGRSDRHRANDGILPDRQRTVTVLRHPERNLAGSPNKSQPRQVAPANLVGRDHAA
jgi:hypothetical protein